MTNRVTGTTRKGQACKNCCGTCIFFTASFWNATTATTMTKKSGEEVAVERMGAGGEGKLAPQKDLEPNMG